MSGMPKQVEKLEANIAAKKLTEAMRKIKTMTPQEREDLMKMPIEDTPSDIQKKMGQAWKSGETESHITNMGKNLSSQFDDVAKVKPQQGGDEEEGRESKGGFLEFFVEEEGGSVPPIDQEQLLLKKVMMIL